MISKAENRFGASIVHTSRLLINNVNSRFTALGTNITFEQLEVLFHIVMNSEKKIIQNDLALITNKNKSGVLRIIDTLETKQFVKRLPLEGDRRKNVIEATREGVIITKRAITLFTRIEKEYLKKIKKEDIVVFSKVLKIIKDECSSYKHNVTV